MCELRKLLENKLGWGMVRFQLDESESLTVCTMHLIVLAAGLRWGRCSHRLHGRGVMT